MSNFVSDIDRSSWTRGRLRCELEEAWSKSTPVTQDGFFPNSVLMGNDRLPLSGGVHPFFSYYGSKWSSALNYPRPKYKTIIEPFAGSAGYSLRRPHLNVILYDVDNKVVGVWDYLIHATEADVLSLPSKVECVDDLAICQEAKWLIGFWLNQGASSPCRVPSSRMRNGLRPNAWWENGLKKRIARQQRRIRHWKVVQGSYEETGDVEGTWFIDPPYIVAGRHYRHRISDYQKLSKWCSSRRGQVIVCEQMGAGWLPFQYLYRINTNDGGGRVGYSDEVVWYGR